MTEFTRKLKWCKRRAGLTTADLAHFFGRLHRTVQEWVVNDRQLTGARRAETLRNLDRLEVYILHGQGFPIPLTLSTRYRATYMRFLGEGRLARARIFAADPPGRGAFGRIREEGRTAKAASIHKSRKTDRTAVET